MSSNDNDNDGGGDVGSGSGGSANGGSGGCCTLEIKTLKGKKVLMEHVFLDCTVEELYAKVSEIEDTPEGKWKLMLIIKSPRTLKPITDQNKTLRDYGAIAFAIAMEDNNNNNNHQSPPSPYRVEVILDMGACHTSCKRN